MSNVHLLSPHENMTPHEALSYSSKENFADVLIIGYVDDDLTIRSSNMSRKDALWLIEFAKRHIMGLDE